MPPLHHDFPINSYSGTPHNRRRQLHFQLRRGDAAAPFQQHDTEPLISCISQPRQRLNRFYAPSLLHQLLPIATIAAILLALAATATNDIPHPAALTAYSTITFDIATSSPPPSLRCVNITHDITAVQRRHFAAAKSFVPLRHPQAIRQDSFVQSIFFALPAVLLRLCHPQATHVPRQ